MIIAVIQARLGSTRLPGKVLLDLEGKSVLERVVERVRLSTRIDKIILATTLNSVDDKIAVACSTIGVDVYRGSENDVLDRFYQAVRNIVPVHVVRITGDCPLIDPVVIDEVINTHMSADADYTSNTLKETFPDGLDTEVFKFKALEEAWKNAKLQSEREHVTPYMRKISNNFKLMNVENFVDISSKRWTLDNTEDYKFISAVYKYFGRSAKFGMQDVLNYLCVNPALEKLNSHITRNEGYLKSIANDKVVK